MAQSWQQLPLSGRAVLTIETISICTIVRHDPAVTALVSDATSAQDLTVARSS
jgi:hypothetical protein